MQQSAFHIHRKSFTHMRILEPKNNAKISSEIAHTAAIFCEKSEVGDSQPKQHHADSQHAAWMCVYMCNMLACTYICSIHLFPTDSVGKESCTTLPTHIICVPMFFCVCISANTNTHSLTAAGVGAVVSHIVKWSSAQSTSECMPWHSVCRGYQPLSSQFELNKIHHKKIPTVLIINI